MSDFDDIQVLKEVLHLLAGLDESGKAKIIGTLNTYFGYRGQGSVERNFVPLVQVDRTQGPSSLREGDFSKNRTVSAKEFLFEKRAQTDVERVACLAYYLTHFLETLDFQTKDISVANTEAAQRKLSNPSVTVSNAVRAGYLISSGKNSWRLSALGEVFVQALPDRDAAKNAVSESKPVRKLKRTKKQRSTKSTNSKVGK